MSYAMSHSMPLVRTSSQKSEEFCPSSPDLSEARWENCGTSAASRKSTDALPSSCRKTLASIASMSPSCVAVSLPWEALSSLQSPGQVGSFQRRRGEVNDEDCAWMPPPLIPHSLCLGIWCVRTDGHDSPPQLGDRVGPRPAGGAGSLPMVLIAGDAGSQHCHWRAWPQHVALSFVVVPAHIVVVLRDRCRPWLSPVS